MAKVTICEMSPRDGMQVLNFGGGVHHEQRVRLIELLRSARLPYVEVGSVVNYKRMPSMEGTIEILQQLRRDPRHPGQVAVLIPNLEKYKLCETIASVETVALFVSAAEGYSVKNTKMSIQDACKAAAEVAAAASKNGHRVRAHVSGSFRDLTPGNGETPAGDVRKVADLLIEAGCDLVALADTDGKATIRDMDRVLGHLHETIGLNKIGVHLHDRYGLAVANAQRAYDIGVRAFDAAVGGIGGNLAVLGGSFGNVATEELAALFECQGIETGLDSEKLLAAAEFVAELSAQVRQPMPPSKVLRDRLDQKQVAMMAAANQA